MAYFKRAVFERVRFCVFTFLVHHRPSNFDIWFIETHAPLQNLRKRATSASAVHRYAAHTTLTRSRISASVVCFVSIHSASRCFEQT